MARTSATPAAPPAAAAADPVIAAAGDIACSPLDDQFNGGAGTAIGCQQRSTSNLLVNRGLTGVLALGDTQYNAGTTSEYQGSYDPTWGRVKNITHPAVGNHEYLTAGAAGYFQYFGAAAGDPSTGSYSFDIGSWHLIALNSNCDQVGCEAGSAQEQWLRNDLSTHSAACTLAYWHHPRWASAHGDNDFTDALWRALYASRADVVLNGHEHDYERFAPQNPDGVADPAIGIREFVVGTGGEDLGDPRPISANSEVVRGDTFGVLFLTLHSTSFDWRFESRTGSTIDSGSSPCHPKSPVADAGPDRTAGSGAVITLDGLGSSDPQGQPLTYGWEQVAGPLASFDDKTKARPTVTLPAGPATVTFRLKVTNTSGLSDTDDVTVTVQAPK